MSNQRIASWQTPTQMVQSLRPAWLWRTTACGLLQLLFSACVLLNGGTQSALDAPAEKKAVPIVSACTLPSTPAGSAEETAWQIFVAINCKVVNQQLTWETWTTQACLLNPADCKTHRLHDSKLRAANAKVAAPKLPRRTGGCRPMTTMATATATLQPFVPTNLSGNPQFCEEVTINASEEVYANNNGLLTTTGQVAFLQSGGTINFPRGAVEVKADWVAASSYNGVTFDCHSPNTTIYQEIIDGTCYALAGMHISSKLYPYWLWATFEPQDLRTNPNRCNPNLYNACIDPWGSSPAWSEGLNTQVTPVLAALFSKADVALDPSFQNYRLTGAQTDFNQPVTSKGNLGSSFIEFNVAVDIHQSSCITCHSYAQRTTIAMSSPPPKGTPVGSTPPAGAPAGSVTVGFPTPLPAAYKPLDFSWFLGFGVPD